MKLLWLDLETTGLEPLTHVPVELAYVLMENGNILCEKNVVIHVNGEAIDKAARAALEMHIKSGLLGESVLSTVYVDGAETILLNDLKKYVPAGEPIMLAGNSVHFDRGFIAKHFPRIDKLLHYRHLDVSVFKTVGTEMKAEEFKQGPVAHRAMADIKNAIEQYKFWTNKLYGKVW